MEQQIEQLIKELKASGHDGAVLYKLDESRTSVTHITPMVQTDNLQGLYDQLSDVKNAIQAFLNDLIDKSLAKN